MPRAQCFCDYAGCGGATVDLQTWNRHKRHDASKRVHSALAAATAACKAQDDYIASQVVSLPPSDSPSAPNASAANTRPSFKSSEQKLVAHLLCQLCDIETSLDSLISSTDEQLINIGKPDSSEDVFPMATAISAAHTIQAQLSAIASRAPSVLEAKSSLVTRSVEFITKLDDAKGLWVKHAAEIPIRQESVDPIFHTGKYIPLI